MCYMMLEKIKVDAIDCKYFVKIADQRRNK